MIEAELKAPVRQPSLMLRTLEGAYGPGRAEVYRDTYYDLPDGGLLAADRELRIRDIESVDGTRRTLRTYKAPRVDRASAAKPEHETAVADADAAHAIVRGLGYRVRLAYRKHCRNYVWEREGRRSWRRWSECRSWRGCSRRWRRRLGARPSSPGRWPRCAGCCLNPGCRRGT